MPDRIAEMIDRVRLGERQAVARSLRWMEDDPELAHELSARLHPHLHGAEIVGITGSPGAGKSTLVDALVTVARRRGRRVAVLAVDPSSPFSGGAILGDRIRMSRHATDDGVFIRSLATRGALGGISQATAASVRVLDVAGYDLVLIETVGVGQDEVDIARLAETTVVVMMPGLGDDVQAIKAGLLEVADIFVINKADREGAADLERALRQSLSLAPARSAWQVPILRTVAARGEGVGPLADAIVDHHRFLASPDGRHLAATRLSDTFERLLDAALVAAGRAALGARIAEARAQLQTNGGDPYAEASALARSWSGGPKSDGGPKKDGDLHDRHMEASS